MESEIPSGLRSVFDTGWFEDLGWVEVSAVSWEKRKAVLDFRVGTGVEAEPVQTWRVRATDVRHGRVFRERASELELLSDHPLLLPIR